MTLLLLAIPAGYLAALGRSWLKIRLGWGKDEEAKELPGIRLAWLVPLAVISQLVVFQFAQRVAWVTDGAVAVILIVSGGLLLLFSCCNLSQPGFWALGVGLALNLVVMAVNGGLMPISPETLTRILGKDPLTVLEIGDRVGKNVILLVVDTHLWWLSDHVLLPSWSPYQVAFSLGDIFIASGVFRTMWARGESPLVVSRAKKGTLSVR
jgi:hypothetical protein